MNPIEQLLVSNDTLLLDGALGTMFMGLGLAAGNPPEEWNVTEPEKVQSVHQAYLDAGSSIILTNSFGGTHFRLKMHGLQDRVADLNRAAAQNVRKVVAVADRTALVGGSMGPTGELLQPMGAMSYEDAVAAFGEQAAALAEGGADLIWIETMSDSNEVKAAVEGARSVCDLPITATMTFDTRGHTMMGLSPAQAVEILKPLGLAAMGANCGNGPSEIEEVVRAMHAADPELIIIAKSNAGIPEWREGGLVYNGTPEVMGAYAQMVRAAGAKLIGGCCGNTPDHIQAMRDALSQPPEMVDLDSASKLVAMTQVGSSATTAPQSSGDRAQRRSPRPRRRSGKQEE